MYFLEHCEYLLLLVQPYIIHSCLPGFPQRKLEMFLCMLPFSLQGRYFPKLSPFVLQNVVQVNRFAHGGLWSDPQSPSLCGRVLHHLHHHHRFLHGEHLCGLCYCHLSERGGAGVQKLRA